MTERLTKHRAAWAIKLIDAQQPLPGIKARKAVTVFRQTVVDSLSQPMLFPTRKKARTHRDSIRRSFYGAGFRPVVVPVRATVEEVPTLFAATQEP
jgi:hypothetical protein